MLSLIDSAAMIAALPTLAPLPRQRVQETLDGELADMTHILIIGPDDAEADIVAEIGFSPLELERLRFSDSSLEPAWDVLHDHRGWFELVFCVANDGFAFVLLIEDHEPPTPLVRLCRTHSRLVPDHPLNR
ncbi:hypothetical protein [Blastomonas sp. UPD001]|uniref:hypothetical protein n=1 Tax=Blastomonas sp. UPD001 TaxID=2217673 RepID=UPI000E34E3B6|nr:hypothetical protein [Blastomonas sp. UPD001]